MSAGREFSSYLAREIVRGTRKSFSAMHGDFLAQLYVKEKTKTMGTPTTSGINTSATHEASLDRSKIGSPADGRKLNATGSTGVTINSGLNVGKNSEVTPITVKQVDHKTIEGSNPGDHRAQPGDTANESLNRAADNGGPRNRVGQFDKPVDGKPIRYGSGSGESQGTGMDGC